VTEAASEGAAKVTCQTLPLWSCIENLPLAGLSNQCWLSGQYVTFKRGNSRDRVALAPSACSVRDVFLRSWFSAVLSVVGHPHGGSFKPP
jgi:hypothetical protein